MKNLRKNTDAQHLLNAHIPWYRSRKFWLILIAAQAISNIVIFYNFISVAEGLVNKIYALTGVLGATTPGVIVGAFVQNKDSGQTITVVIFVTISFVLLRKATATRKINPLFPIVFIVLSLISSLILLIFSGI